MTSGMLNEIIIILTLTVLLAAWLQRYGIPTILLYFLVGIVVGPNVTGLVSDPHAYHILAEFGVAFLLFTLGLEFSLPRLFALRKTVFGMGSLQVVICLAVFLVANLAWGSELSTAFIAASALALSSTAIVTKELARYQQINTRHGQIAIGILLFQDIAAVVLLIFLSATGKSGDSGLFMTLIWTLIKGAGYFLFIGWSGKYILPPLFTRISATKSPELFVLTVLTVALSAAAIAHFLGLAMALGAFMAGMMLGESHFRHQIENEIRPFRDLLLGLFFVSIGFMVNFELLTEYWYRILFFSACLIIFKCALITLLCVLLGDKHSDALRAGVVLCQGGEFGFALIAMGQGDQLIPVDQASFFVSIIVVSMAVTPFLMKHVDPIAQTVLRRLSRSTQTDPLPAFAHDSVADSHSETAVEQNNSEKQQHVMILGYGRVGQALGRFMQQEDIPYVAIDDDPARVRMARDAGETVFFGDTRNLSILEKLGLDHAALVVISFDDYLTSKHIIVAIRATGNSRPIIVRSRDDSHADALIEAGADEVIPEIHEASLTIVSAVMASLNIANDRIDNLLNSVRASRYNVLKGYFLGEKSRQSLSPDVDAQIMQPVYLPQGAWACSKAPGELNLAPHDVTLHSIRRQDQTLLAPFENLLFERGDIVVLGGKISQVEAAEAYLLTGVH
ncbi:MAG: cation:proton antiporter [Pseudomonadales bacterium]|nr:cation:proton antiporter [Pseudomonadales bacterium]